MTNMVTGYIEREVTSSVALLDHLPPDRRAAWLPKLAHRSYTFTLGPGGTRAPPHVTPPERFAQSIEAGIGKRYPLTVNTIAGEAERIQIHLKLSDGAPLTIDMRPMLGTPQSGWLPAVPLQEHVVLATCCWLAVRNARQQAKQLAKAANALGPDLKAQRLPETGPNEIASAAKAFNAMQDRIAMYTAQRMQTLAAITHDLQTPITRMRLRVDIMDDSTTGEKLRQYLEEMETLVKEGVAYACTLQGTPEEAVRIDPDALIGSIVNDYRDAGRPVTMQGCIGHAMTVRPKSLKRIVGNLVDNALNYSGEADVVVEVSAMGDGHVRISVLDRGPGIPEESLETVFEPFVRLEASRNRQTGGTGLGLASARQLAGATNGVPTLINREDGGLEARLVV